jgi:hypothetical protein
MDDKLRNHMAFDSKLSHELGVVFRRSSRNPDIPLSNRTFFCQPMNRAIEHKLSDMQASRLQVLAVSVSASSMSATHNSVSTPQQLICTINSSSNFSNTCKDPIPLTNSKVRKCLNSQANSAGRVFLLPPFHHWHSLN